LDVASVGDTLVAVECFLFSQRVSGKVEMPTGGRLWVGIVVAVVVVTAVVRTIAARRKDSESVDDV
jgi:hypothetical protein